MNALRKHLSRIAKERQEKLRKKLGKVGYSKAMSKLSRKRVKKQKAIRAIVDAKYKKGV